MSAIQMNPLIPNILPFKTETSRSMHSLSFFGFDDVVIGVHHSPVKAPQKVLNATTLQDDLYPNLVDWSSHNVLVVGLGNFVYLWNACSSKLTKLCDLGIDDSWNYKCSCNSIRNVEYDLDIMMVRATKHIECPPKEKHLRIQFLNFADFSDPLFYQRGG
ncbi:hypothetical protein TB1_034484 [Malus domestica]